jgi:cytidylate kinase
VAAVVVAVDGPAASGKGTIAAGVAQALRFHLLDSGSLYRRSGPGASSSTGTT